MLKELANISHKSVQSNEHEEQRKQTLIEMVKTHSKVIEKAS